MDTYGDMVTLLLTFFVMLYASSSFDAQKWQYILQAFTSRGDVLNPVVSPTDPNSTSDLPYLDGEEYKDGEAPKTFDQLYQYLLNYVNNNNLSTSVELEKGKSNIYIKFRDNIFFGGDSSVLLDSGKAVLNPMSEGIKAVDDKIRLIKVAGHTAVGKYSVVDDTQLSAERAVNVVNYLKDLKAASPDKFVSMGYGSYRPIAPNDTEENKRINRRVEIIIVRNDADFSDPAVIDEYLKMEFGADYVDEENNPKSTTSSAK